MSRAILLVPGWGDRSRSLRHIRSYLLRAGHAESTIHAMEFRARFGSNIEHAEEIAAAVEALRKHTSAERVDVVAHSMGGLALRYYLHFHAGGSKIRRVVFTGTPHRGTWVAYLGWGKGAREMRPGHQLLAELRRLPSVPTGVSALCIHTPMETRVLPQNSALLPDTRHQRVWCPSHPRLLRSKKVFAAIRQFLQE